MSTTLTLPSASAALFSRTWHVDDGFNNVHDDVDGDNDHDEHLCKLELVLLDLVPVDIAQLSVLPNLVWWPGKRRLDHILQQQQQKQQQEGEIHHHHLAQTGSPLM